VWTYLRVMRKGTPQCEGLMVHGTIETESALEGGGIFPRPFVVLGFWKRQMPELGKRWDKRFWR